MKIYLKSPNKRKIVYDILNIFYESDEILFADSGDLSIYDKKISFLGKSYEYENNYQLKAILYKILAKENSYTSPWGMLTGSKPSKLLQKYNTDEIKEKYFLADEKINLLAEIKNQQEKLSFKSNDFNLYINIPFCPSRCQYCSYPTLIGTNHDKSSYVDLLLREIREINLPENLDTIYIGGGTPSYLKISDIKRLLELINEKFTYQEFTFEAGREDTLDFEKLKLLRENGVDRISLNPQTFNENIIKATGRAYDLEHFLEIYNYAKKLGFIINMDFIVGLVGEDANSFRENFEILKKLLPDNITFHALARKVGSKYMENNKRGSIKEALKISDDIGKFVKENSYKPYYLYRQKNIISNLENVGYQRENTAQRYNIIINEELENIIGLGMNANSKLINNEKYRNARNMKDYEALLDEEISDKNKMIENYKKWI
ncbi:coproporphyrinogen dehydrogenase HemZ [Anaerococcus sp. Marseille-P9784]|uniref:coproporphyrinogen dehydrogenase HemZ n=1 Tax=Anaerococcus sp. Marseille-P9784 TaxID=2614127 RepID=UPI001249C872|nr:coproporphyrinogen dehydrogenase HemZ [Anaerococcus sp. Marseille-P9784]